MTALTVNRLYRGASLAGEVVKYNMEDSQFNVEDAGNRAEWRRSTRVADLLPLTPYLSKKTGVQSGIRQFL